MKEYFDNKHLEVGSKTIGTTFPINRVALCWTEATESFTVGDDV